MRKKIFLHSSMVKKNHTPLSTRVYEGDEKQISSLIFHKITFKTLLFQVVPVYNIVTVFFIFNENLLKKKTVLLFRK